MGSSLSHPLSAPPGTSTRDTWVDVLKGVLVVEVVLHHVRTAMEDYGARLTVVALLDDIAAPVRMPAMFVLSGLFAGRLVLGPPRRVWRERVGGLSYLVALWFAIALLVTSLSAQLLGKSTSEALDRVVDRMLDGVQPLWFLVALAIFVVYSRMVRRWPLWLQFSVAALLALTCLLPGVPGIVGQWWHVPFFLLGLHAPIAIRKVASALRVDRLGQSRFGRGWAWIGRRTMPIFLVHAVTLPLALRVAPLNVAGALAATVLLVATSLAFFTVSRRVPGLWALPPVRAVDE